MKQQLSILALVFSVFFSAFGFSQGSSAIFFSENGALFYLYLNNQLQNEIPQSQVKVENLILKDYQVTVEFKDITKDRVRTDLKIKQGRESVFVVFQENSGYSIDLYSKAKKGMYSPSQNEVIIERAGYKGKLSCPIAISDEEFSSMLETVANTDYPDAKLDLSKEIVSSNCITVNQLHQLMGSIDYEPEKIELAKFAYSYVFDRDNYINLADLFEYPDSKKEITNWIKLNIEK